MLVTMISQIYMYVSKTIRLMAKLAGGKVKTRSLRAKATTFNARALMPKPRSRTRSRKTMQ